MAQNQRLTAASDVIGRLAQGKEKDNLDWHALMAEFSSAFNEENPHLILRISKTARGAAQAEVLPNPNFNAQ